MRFLFSILIATVVFLSISAIATANAYTYRVRGYTRSNGTYVNSYVRNSPKMYNSYTGTYYRNSYPSYNYNSYYRW